LQRLQKKNGKVKQKYKVTTMAVKAEAVLHRVRKKKSLEYFGHNFIKYWPIFEILSLLQSAGNLQ